MIDAKDDQTDNNNHLYTDSYGNNKAKNEKVDGCIYMKTIQYNL